MKEFYFKNYTVNFPLRCTPSPRHILSICFSIGQSNAGSLVRASRSSTDFCFTSSIYWNWFTFKANLILRKRKKSQGAKSGKYGPWLYKYYYVVWTTLIDNIVCQHHLGYRWQICKHYASCTISPREPETMWERECRWKHSPHLRCSRVASGVRVSPR